MSLISELSLMQAKKYQLKLEKDEIGCNLLNIRENVNENKPPQKNSELEFLKRL